MIASPGSSPLGIPIRPNSGPGELSVKQEEQLCHSHFSASSPGDLALWILPSSSRQSASG